MAKGKKRYRRGRRRSFWQRWSMKKKVISLVSLLLVLIMTCGVTYAANQFSKLDTKKINVDKLEISEVMEKQTGYLNVALFGLDSRDGSLDKGNRSDTIIVASLNKATGEIRMVSVYRDTLLQMKDNSYNKANAAYSFGGPTDAINMLNRNLDLNIEKYVAIDFSALVDVIEALGGIDAELTVAEIKDLNNINKETSGVTGRAYEAIKEQAGTYHLSGAQAVTYARIRHTEGGDFKRAERQQYVLAQIAEKAKHANFAALNKILNAVFPKISTNFTVKELLGYVKYMANLSVGGSQGFPAENHCERLSQIGDTVIPNSLSGEVLKVHQFLFPDEQYQASAAIQTIESGIGTRKQNKASADETFDGDDDSYAGSSHTATRTSGRSSNSGSSQTATPTRSQPDRQQTNSNKTAGSNSGGNQSNTGQSNSDQNGGDTQTPEKQSPDNSGGSNSGSNSSAGGTGQAGDPSANTTE